MENRVFPKTTLKKRRVPYVECSKGLLSGRPFGVTSMSQASRWAPSAPPPQGSPRVRKKAARLAGGPIEPKNYHIQKPRGCGAA